MFRFSTTPRRLILLVTLAWAGPGFAAVPDLLLSPPPFAGGLSADGFMAKKPAAVATAVQLNSAALSTLQVGDTLRLNLPGRGFYTVVMSRREQLNNGNQVWAGYLQELGDMFRVVLTLSPEGHQGSILTPDGNFHLVTQQGQLWLVDEQASGLTPPPVTEDDAKAPPTRLPRSSSATQHIQALPAPQSTIDVLVYYSPGMVTRYGSGLQARLDHLFALANQAYIDSEVAITIRAVRYLPYNYADNTSNSSLLNDLTFTFNQNARDQYGADLVVFVRPYDKDTHGSCGVGWIGGGDLSTPVPELGFSVVSDGSDVNGSNYYCGEYTFAHELGHNMGNMHDHANAGSGNGAYTYSYGYNVNGNFGTVMSYPGPRIGRFSNPNLLCASPGLTPVACGVAEGSPGAADNARSMNNTRASIAGFKPQRVSYNSASADDDNDGVPNGIEPDEGLVFNVKDNNLFANTAKGQRLFVMQQFRDLLYREGTSTAISYWAGQMAGGMSRSDVILAYLNSNAANTQIKPLGRLMFAYFSNLFPNNSANGMLYWGKQLTSGSMTLDQISTAFANSAAFANKYGVLSDSQFVDVIYQNTLGRSATVDEQSSALTQINNQGRGAFARTMAQNPSFISSSDNRLFVEMIFSGMGRRAPTASGEQFWLDKLALNATAGKTEMINAYLGALLPLYSGAASSYRARFLP